MNTEYVIIDIETTGLDVENSSIIEIGAILITKGKINGRYSSLVRYSGKLPETTKRLTGITDSMLKNAPPIERVIHELNNFIQRRPVVAHNGFSFDFRFLKRAGLKLNEKYDSMEFAFFILPINEVGHSVAALAKYFSLGMIPHRALPDCELEFEILQKLQIEWSGKDRKKAAALKFVSEQMGWWWTHFLSGKSEKIIDISSLVEAHKPYRKKNTEQDKLSLGINPIDIDTVQKFFVPGGIAEYSEDRPEQRDMAKFIAEAFNEKTHAVVEAGTGVGKSKSYLVPSVLFSMKNDVPVVISTYTKALQDQLAFKEINHVRDIIKPDLRVAVVKGKQNYVCLSKFREFAVETFAQSLQRSLYEHTEDETRFTTRLVLILLSSWIIETERGDWDELPYWLVERIPKRIEQDICNLDEMCTKDICELFDAQKCFYAKARLRAKDADLVVMNHAILLTGIHKIISREEVIESDDVVERQEIIYGHSLLPSEAKFIVLDEAHHLEDAATSAWTAILSQPLFEKLLRQLYNKNRGAMRILDGIAKGSNDSRMNEAAMSFISIEKDLRLDINTLFKEILDILIPIDPLAKWSIKLSFTELLQSPNHMKPLLDILTNIRGHLRQVQTILIDFSKKTDNEKLKKSLIIYDRLVERIISTTSVILNDDEYYVRYIERLGPMVQILAAPLSIASEMKERVYNNFSSVVLTSATITVCGRFSFFAHRCGTNLVDSDHIRYLQRPSSFDFSRQVQFFVPKGITYGSKQQEKEAHLNQCLDFLKEAIVACQGGALILCSSHEQVNQLYTNLAEYLSHKNIWLLRQSKDQSITSIIRDFTNDINSVLIGTAALWQGVDVPGPSLRALFIYKIPYCVPTDPLIKARCEEVKQAGRNSFSSYYEPLAALDLKQGFGRLIRKKTDVGIVVMLDNRLMRKNILLNSLPCEMKKQEVETSEIFAALSELTRMVDVRELPTPF